MENATRLSSHAGDIKQEGDMGEVELFKTFKTEFEDLGFRDFNELLMQLEVSGKIWTTSPVPGKRRVVLIKKQNV